MKRLFRPLIEELGGWRHAGRVAAFWWRDDDAPADSAALARLLALSRDRGVACALAVVPARELGELEAALRDEPLARVLQHGYAHANHAAGPRQSEYGLDRPLRVMLEELDRGRRRLAQAFGERFQPILVPPWNRIDPALVPRLPEVGLRAVSADAALPPVPGVAQFQVHCDLVDWSDYGLAGEQAVSELVAHLRLRRAGAVDSTAPTGVMTHHWAHSEATWEFLEELIATVAAHPAAAWVDPADFV